MIEIIESRSMEEMHDIYVAPTTFLARAQAASFPNKADLFKLVLCTMHKINANLNFPCKECFVCAGRKKDLVDGSGNFQSYRRLTIASQISNFLLLEMIINWNKPRFLGIVESSNHVKNSELTDIAFAIHKTSPQSQVSFFRRFTKDFSCFSQKEFIYPFADEEVIFQERAGKLQVWNAKNSCFEGFTERYKYLSTDNKNIKKKAFKELQSFGNSRGIGAIAVSGTGGSEVIEFTKRKVRSITIKLEKQGFSVSGLSSAIFIFLFGREKKVQTQIRF